MRTRARDLQASMERGLQELKIGKEGLEVTFIDSYTITWWTVLGQLYRCRSEMHYLVPRGHRSSDMYSVLCRMLHHPESDQVCFER